MVKQIKESKISGGHISTTAISPDGKKSDVELFHAGQFEKPESYHRFPKMNSARKRGCRFWYYFPASEIARIRIPAASMARQRYCFF